MSHGQAEGRKPTPIVGKLPHERFSVRRTLSAESALVGHIDRDAGPFTIEADAHLVSAKDVTLAKLRA